MLINKKPIACATGFRLIGSVFGVRRAPANTVRVSRCRSEPLEFLSSKRSHAARISRTFSLSRRVRVARPICVWRHHGKFGVRPDPNRVIGTLQRIANREIDFRDSNPYHDDIFPRGAWFQALPGRCFSCTTTGFRFFSRLWSGFERVDCFDCNCIIKIKLRWAEGLPCRVVFTMFLNHWFVSCRSRTIAQTVLIQ